MRSLSIILYFFGFGLSAQTINGIVLNEKGNPLSNARIEIPELHRQSLSSDSGYFTISVPEKGFVSILVEKDLYQYHFQTVVLPYNDRLKIQLKVAEQELDEIVIYGTQTSNLSETSNTIDFLTAKTLRNTGALSVSDGLARIPGISQLTTGPGISKPVVRGLYGNRVQVVLFGLRFDNQQWQDEHGLGISDIGVNEVEVIKGPSSIFYGSEALGGVINIIGEKPASSALFQADAGIKYFSNSFGYATNVGVKKTGKNFNYGLRIGNESHADYTDGNGKRVLNSRFGGTTAQAFAGFRKNKWQSDNTYYFTQNNFGFLMDAYQVLGPADDRQARSFQMPHHTVMVNLASSRNTIYFGRSQFKADLGAVFNDRQEQEGGSGISLHMLLNSYSANFMWKTRIGVNDEFSIGNQNFIQSNRNTGSRTIVPDADINEHSLYAFYKAGFKDLVAEGGVSYNLRYMDIYQTGTLNNGDPFKPGVEIKPGSQSYSSFNASGGLSLKKIKNLLFKISASSGYRSPSLAELSSNGLHEGSLRYEIGNPDLKIEQNVCADIFAQYEHRWLTVFATAYYNQFKNYIYLQGTSEEYLGFMIYRYRQQDALIQGYESGLTIGKKILRLKTSYSGISGLSSKKENLPFIPAARLNTELQLHLRKIESLQNTSINIGLNHVFAQARPAEFETSTPAYQLLYANASTELLVKKHLLEIGISASNILNEVYADHLSRYKYYNIYNQGRSINFNLKYFLNHEH